jgi:hypothetical protein
LIKRLIGLTILTYWTLPAAICTGPASGVMALAAISACAASETQVDAAGEFDISATKTISDIQQTAVIATVQFD